MKIFRVGLLVAFLGLMAFLGSLMAATPPDHTAGLRKSPEYVFNMPDGKQLLLSSLRGKVVVIAFMFTTCPHCQAACPLFAGIQRDYAAKGVQFVGDVIDPGAKDGVADFSQRHVRGAFPVGWSLEDAAREYMRIPFGKNFYVPMLSFIDAKGNIHSQYIGDNDFFKDMEPNIRAELDKMLGAPAKTAVSKK
jgi:thiol-disulfide isomerase/thioredoxin